MLQARKSSSQRQVGYEGDDLVEGLPDPVDWVVDPPAHDVVHERHQGSGCQQQDAEDEKLPPLLLPGVPVARHDRHDHQDDAAAKGKPLGKRHGAIGPVSCPHHANYRPDQRHCADRCDDRCGGEEPDHVDQKVEQLALFRPDSVSPPPEDPKGEQGGDKREDPWIAEQCAELALIDVQSDHILRY